MDRDEDGQRREENPADPEPRDPPGIPPQEERRRQRPVDAKVLNFPLQRASLFASRGSLRRQTEPSQDAQSLDVPCLSNLSFELLLGDQIFLGSPVNMRCV